MTHALVTIVCHVAPDRVDEVRALVEALGNPASAPVHAAFESLASDEAGLAIHFASMTVFPASGGGGHLVFEFSGDGDERSLIRVLAERLGPHVNAVYALASDRGTAGLDRYWFAHRVTVGQGYFDNPGVLFVGTPGMSVRRIRAERALRDRLMAMSEDATLFRRSALDRVNAIRVRLGADSTFSWALQPEDADALHEERTTIEAVRAIVPNVIRMYLWPLAIPPIVILALALLMDPTMLGLARALMDAFVAFLVTIAVVTVGGGIAYLVFRRREDSDIPDHRAPDPAHMARIVARENHAIQNHLAGVSTLKPGLLRKLTLRLVFAAIVQLATYLYRPGWLGTLGTIHFARWVMVPGTGDLLFLSNFGGSWESYLEDFITKAHNGLTGVWSNSIGFPKTQNLIQRGASDGDFFKRWARRHQVPTGCWFSAYPDLTTTHIRANAIIRQGLATLLTEEEAIRWLTYFGSQPRPANALEANEVQSIVFGGLGFLPFGMAIGFKLGDRAADARAWLNDVRKDVAFGDGRKHGARAIVLSLAATALEKLLPTDGLATFPSAYLQGMSATSRSRILGDEYENAPDRWTWGGPHTPVDGLLLIYAPTEEVLTTSRVEVRSTLMHHGHAVTMEVEFEPLPGKDATADQRRLAKLEPFGFADGISQPIIRGTYKSLRAADPIHLVEPGEFLLGYPDNRGNQPAGPVLPAIHDPDNVLPIATSPQTGFALPIVNDERDIGRNGTFLAVRQLEQDTDGFWQYCSQAAATVAGLFPQWIDVTPEFIGAKLVGRWPDGSSLVRFPYRAGSEEDGDHHPRVRPSVGAGEPGQPPQVPPPHAPAPVAASSGSVNQARATPLKVRRTNAPVRPVAVTPDNDFLFGAEDPQGLRCPFGAHIRRTNPRESFDPGSREQLTITNRHRILRVGRRYAPPQGRQPGLLFMCLNADLERQFEFVQQTWAQANAFQGLAGERDPILGSRDRAHAQGAIDDSFTVPTRDGPVRLRNMPEFVRTLGGGYFFVPGKSFLDYLATRRVIGP